MTSLHFQRALPLRPELAQAEPYGAPQLGDVMCLNVNENPYPPPAQVIDTILKRVHQIAGRLNRYPDRDFRELRCALAAYLSREGTTLSGDQIWAANGSNEVMLHILQAFGGPGRTVVSFGPTYSMYPEYARGTHTRWVAGHRTAEFAIELDHVMEVLHRERPSVLLLASPNNPTGTALGLDMIRAIATAAGTTGPDGLATVVVIDEAYGEFRRVGTQSAVTLLPEFAHLAVSRTMSKAFAFAGVRLGYLAASDELVRALTIVRLPYHLSAVTQAVALGALNHVDDMLVMVDQLRQERDATAEWLRQQKTRDGIALHVAESDANFVLFGQFADRHAVWQGLVNRGILIRETGPEGWLRVSIGTPDEMAAFRVALQEVI